MNVIFFPGDDKDQDSKAAPSEVLQGSVVRETQEYQILPTQCLAVANAAALSLSFLPNAHTNLKGKHGCLLEKPTAGSGQNQNYFTEELSYKKLHKVPLWETAQAISAD